MENRNGVIYLPSGNLHNVQHSTLAGALSTFIAAGSSPPNDGFDGSTAFPKPRLWFKNIFYVGDAATSGSSQKRIYKYDQNGNLLGGGIFIQGFGGSIADIEATQDGNLLVFDQGAKVIRKFDMSGNEIVPNPFINLASFSNPQAMEVDPSGRILVLDYSDNVVAAFNANGAFPKNIRTAADGLSQGQYLLYAPEPATLAWRADDAEAQAIAGAEIRRRPIEKVLLSTLADRLHAM